MNNSYRAAFLDREGVITELEEFNIEENKLHFITKIEEIKLIPRVTEAIKILNEHKIKTIVITNQPQIGRGIITEEKYKEIENHINKLLEKNGAKIDATYYCPHHPNQGIDKYKTECECRKPKPGMIIQAEKEHNINLKKSFMIGDRTADIKAGNLAGCKTILVKTGYGGNDGFKDAEPDYIVENLLEAVKIITK